MATATATGYKVPTYKLTNGQTIRADSMVVVSNDSGTGAYVAKVVDVKASTVHSRFRLVSVRYRGQTINVAATRILRIADPE